MGRSSNRKSRGFCEDFDRAVAAGAYRLVLAPGNGHASRLEWVSQDAGAETRHTSEPLATTWQRCKVWFLSLLPIEPLL